MLELVGDFAELRDVALRQELRLVDQNAVELARFSSSAIAANRSMLSS